LDENVVYAAKAHMKCRAYIVAFEIMVTEPYRTLHNTPVECAIFPLLIVEPKLLPVVHSILEDRKIVIDKDM